MKSFKLVLVITCAMLLSGTILYLGKLIADGYIKAQNTKAMTSCYQGNITACKKWLRSK